MAELTNTEIAVLEKVKKLLALANNNDNEHQAALAAQKAADILEAHNLDAALLTKTASTRSDKQRSGGLYAWQRDLFKAVAELNFCMYWSIKGLKAGEKYQHRILGSAVNVHVAESMGDYLQGAVERLTREYVKNTAPGDSIFKREYIAYREGMAKRLTERLNEARREKLAAEQAQHSDGTGLVLLSLVHAEADANNDYLYSLPPGTTAKQRAEQDARQAAWRERWKEEDAADEIWRALFPEDAAKKDAEDEAYWAKRSEERAKKEERNAKKRKGDGIRYRNMTPAEERARLHTFRSGYDKADDISLNDQVEREKRGTLK